MQTFYKICLILMIVGGINWGLVGLFQFDFVGWLLGGSGSIWSRIVFTLVGVAALCGIPGLFADEEEKHPCQRHALSVACGDSVSVMPSQSPAATAPPKWEPLAYRKSSCKLSKVFDNTKCRALLPRSTSSML